MFGEWVFDNQELGKCTIIDSEKYTMFKCIHHQKSYNMNILQNFVKAGN